MHLLIVETGKHKGKRLKLPDGESIFGREAGVSVRIASNEVSRRHCLVKSQGVSLVVRDLGSSNGTFVNGAPIRGETALEAGDILMIGPMGFRVEGSIAPAAARRPAPSRAQEESLSDDDIAVWLTKSGDETVSSGDTAVLPAATPPEPTPEPIIPAPRKTFKTTAEEAADIIRRHREALSGKDRA
jgi:hypothetical protein